MLRPIPASLLLTLLSPLAAANDCGWTETAKILPSVTGQDMQYGTRLALSGNVLVVGAPDLWHPTMPNGGVFVYGESGGVWSESQRLVASDDGSTGTFGGSLERDGDKLVIASVHDPALVSSGGSVYVFEVDTLIRPFCFGDGSTFACPCANESAPGDAAGCLNSTGSGAQLVGLGSTGVAANDLVLEATDVPAGQYGLYFHGDATVQLPFGDGVRCVGGGLFRYPLQLSDGSLTQEFIASIGGWSAGQTGFFQSWFRDPFGSPCETRFNVSNALEVTFCP